MWMTKGEGGVVLNYQIFWIQKFQNLSNIFDIKGGSHENPHGF